MISKNTIEKVFEISRVEEVIGEFIQLKKSGSNYKGLSPFTNEKTPSFMISPAKQIWKDFSSGKGGNVVAFLMEHEQLSYPQAIKFLAKKYNIEVEETAISSQQKEKIDQKLILDSALYGGDDYELLFSCDPSYENSLVKLSSKMNLKLTKIGIFKKFHKEFLKFKNYNFKPKNSFLHF